MIFTGIAKLWRRLWIASYEHSRDTEWHQFNCVDYFNLLGITFVILQLFTWVAVLCWQWSCGQVLHKVPQILLCRLHLGQSFIQLLYRKERCAYMESLCSQPKMLHAMPHTAHLVFERKTFIWHRIGRCDRPRNLVCIKAFSQSWWWYLHDRLFAHEKSSTQLSSERQTTGSFTMGMSQTFV